MAKQKKNARELHGILVVDKGEGMSSNQLLQRVKYLYRARKAGHTGTLDPMATGVMVLCFGRATKISEHLLGVDKAYRVRCQLGQTTETGDREGTIIETKPVLAEHRQRIAETLARFTGDIEQIPPMFSALKQKGVPLYKLARQGKQVERAARKLKIHELSLLEQQDDELELYVRCSKGTYIRTLVEDIGAALGCGAHASALRRVEVGDYSIEAAYSLDELEVLAEKGPQYLDTLLTPIESALVHYPAVKLQTGLIELASRGRLVRLDHEPDTPFVRIYDSGRVFHGLGSVQTDGRVKLKNLHIA